MSSVIDYTDRATCPIFGDGAAAFMPGLIKRGAEVQVVITPAGKEFITPITLSALTSKPVISEFFAQRDGTWNSHVDLGLWADAMLIDVYKRQIRELPDFHRYDLYFRSGCVRIYR